MRRKWPALLAGLALAAVVPAWGGSVNFTFATLANGTATPQNAGLGAAQVTFLGSDGGTTLTAEGITCGISCLNFFEDLGPIHSLASPGPDLFYKVTGDPSETGLGMVGSSDHEVSTTEAIVFNTDFPPPFSALTIIGSLQAGEGFDVFGCGPSAGACALLGTAVGGGQVSVTIPNASAFTDLGITAIEASNGIRGINQGPSADILLNSVTYSSTVPEPATLALFGTALLLLGLIGLGRRQARSL